jgi:2-succinyl-5-enolpyruvyl-6-hydroxy-3-cyclohexene-1-carboxylate synthase
VRRLDDAAIAQLVSRCAAERGLIVVGSGASSGLEDAVIADAVLRLSAVTGWPVLAEGHTAARHRDGALKAWPHLLENDAFRDANRPEIVMRIGRATLTRTLSELTHRAREIVIDAHGRWWDPARRMSELLPADPADTLNRIADTLGMSTSSIWTDRWRAADAAAAGVLDAAFTEDAPGPEGTQQPVSAGARAVRAVIDGAPLGAHVVVAASMAIRHVDRQSLQRPDLVWHANRGAAGIDGNVSTALGVAIGSRLPVVAIVGDLALLHDTNAWLLTAETDEAAPDVTVVVLDDDGGSIFDLLPPGQFPAQRHLFATPHGRNLRNLAALHDLAFIDVPIGGTSSAAVTGAVAGAVGPGRRLIRVAVPPQAREQSGALRTLVAVALAGIPGD